MPDYNSILYTILDSAKKFFYPEEWIALDLNFSKSELFTMLLVERHGEIIMSQIAEYINVPMSTATGVVERLVRNEYIERGRSEADRRVVVIKLTDKGRTLIDELKNRLIEYISIIYESLTDEEKQLLSNIFFKALDILNKKIELESHEQSKSPDVKRINIE